MSASQFVIEHIISVLGGAGILVTGLATYLGKLLADRSLLKEKAALESLLQKAKSDHEMSIKMLEKDVRLELVKKDQFHQISKTTFENIFNKKIEIYSNLLKLKTNYERFRYESGSFDFVDPSDDFLSHFNLFRKNIESNRLYISNDLSDKYDSWYLDAAQYFRKIEEVEFNISLHSFNGIESDYHEAIWSEQSPIISALVANTLSKMTEVIEQIEADVKQIRAHVSAINANA